MERLENNEILTINNEEFTSKDILIFREAHKNGKDFFVYADETRPRCQGLLTAWELYQASELSTLYPRHSRYQERKHRWLRNKKALTSARR